MPTYDYKCRDCGERFALFYKSYAAYDAASPTCPNCASDALSRLITSVSIQTPTRDYTGMSSNEMLSVFESGDSRQVGEMFQQIGGTDPRLGKEYQDATERLLKGDSMDSVEKSLSEKQSKPTTDQSSGSAD